VSESFPQTLSAEGETPASAIGPSLYVSRSTIAFIVGVLRGGPRCGGLGAGPPEAARFYLPFRPGRRRQTSSATSRGRWSSDRQPPAGNLRAAPVRALIHQIEPTVAGLRHEHPSPKWSRRDTPFRRSSAGAGAWAAFAVIAFRAGRQSASNGLLSFSVSQARRQEIGVRMALAGRAVERHPAPQSCGRSVMLAPGGGVISRRRPSAYVPAGPQHGGTARPAVKPARRPNHARGLVGLSVLIGPSSAALLPTPGARAPASTPSRHSGLNNAQRLNSQTVSRSLSFRAAHVSSSTLFARVVPRTPSHSGSRGLMISCAAGGRGPFACGRRRTVTVQARPGPTHGGSAPTSSRCTRASQTRTHNRIPGVVVHR